MGVPRRGRALAIERLRAPGKRKFRTVATYAGDTVADVVVLRARIKKGSGDPRNLSATSLGLAVYDPSKNEWAKDFVRFPTAADLGGSWNSFYSPELNVHVFHIAGDGRTNGRVLLYRHRR